MTGPIWSVIGFEPGPCCRASSTPCRRASRWAAGPVVFNALQIDIDPATGRALAIERIQRLVERD